MNLVLSLFPGIGLLDMAFEEEGFCVVRGPDVLWGGDIKKFHPPAGKFDGVIGGPPCKAHSRLKHLIIANGYKLAEDLIPEFVRVVSEAATCWFLMENVPEAPLPVVDGYQVHAILINNRWCGGVQNRVRRFSFGTRDGRRLAARHFWGREPEEFSPAVCASGAGRKVPVAIGGSGKVKKTRAIYAADDHSAKGLSESIRLQGLPADFLADAPFTVEGKHTVVGNGVPLPLGRAIAVAVREALEDTDTGRRLPGRNLGGQTEGSTGGAAGGLKPSASGTEDGSRPTKHVED